jgi:hypothetical protein
MKIKELLLENKKEAKSPIKPRNFVAKNAMKTTSGAGAHTDKKKAQKQGYEKHKGKELAEKSLREFATDGSGKGGGKNPRNPGRDPWGGNDGPGEDPYKYPQPEHYNRSIDFFSQFEADHFDKEDFDEATGVFKGYWDYNGKLIQIAYFKFDKPQRNGNDDPGMGWYYEPDEESLAENRKQKPKRSSPKVNNQKTQGPTFTGMAGKGYTPGTGMSGREFTGVSQALTSTYTGMAGSDRGGYTAQNEPETEPSTDFSPTSAAAPEPKSTKKAPMPSFISKNFNPKIAGSMDIPSEQELEWQGREENRFPHYYQHKAYNTRFRDKDGRLITPKDEEWDSYYRQTFDMPTPNDGGWYRQGPDGEEAMVEGMFGLSAKEKGKIQNIAMEISDIPGYYDFRRDRFTPYGVLELQKALDDNDEYVKYALSLTSDDYELESLAEEKQKGVDGKACWKGYKRMGTKMKGGKRVDNCVPMKKKKK